LLAGACPAMTTKKAYTNNITTDDFQMLFVKQNGECLKFGEFMKTCGYSKGDKNSFQLIQLTARKDTPKIPFNYFVGAVIVRRKLILMGIKNKNICIY
jgi:hypothetical protein